MKKRILKLLHCALIISILVLGTINVSAVSREDDVQIELVYFYSTTCGSCGRISEFLENVTTPGFIVDKYNIYEITSMRLLEDYCKAYKVPEPVRGQVPIVFAGDTYFFGEDEIQIGVQVLVNAGQPVHTVDAEVIRTDNSQNKRLSLTKVIVSALVNGLNPCSISIFLFLVMMLTSNQSVNIPKMGVAFCAGKAVAFCLIGTVLFRIFGQIDNLALVTVVNWIIILIYTVFCVLNVRDFLVLAGRQKKNMLSQLPTVFRRFSHNVIRRFSNQRNGALLPVLGVLLGMLIACTEFMCSGQIYLTTIVEMVHTRNADLHFSSLCLAIYSIVFVSPMLCMIMFLAHGKKLFEVSAFFAKHTAIIKLVNAIFFLGFIIYMIGKEIL